MSRVPKLAFLIVCLLLLAYGLVLEHHEVRSFRDGPAEQVKGPAFVEGVTVDSFLRRDEWLYNIYSLSPLEASQKDCKT